MSARVAVSTGLETRRPRLSAIASRLSRPGTGRSKVLVPQSRKVHVSRSSETWTFRHHSNLCNLRNLRMKLFLRALRVSVVG